LSGVNLPRRLVAEGIGTAMLLAAGTALVALILTFGAVSGAHFNPAVSFADASQGGLSLREASWYAGAQVAGAVFGVLAAHVMFDQALFVLSRHARSGFPQVFSEVIATFGLLSVIWGCSRRRSAAVPFAVGAYITAAYWFTASTSFANPAVTIARALTDTFSGIRPTDVPGFIAGQAIGAAAATLLFRWLVPFPPETADRVAVPQEPRYAHRDH
jgi:glycerol uptake facilitator-like aquaporin